MTDHKGKCYSQPPKKENAWKDDAQVKRDAARNEFLAKRYGTTDSIENAYEAAQERSHSAAMGGRVVRDGEHVVASMTIMDSEAASEVERGARALSAVHDAQAQRQAARQEWIDQRQSRGVLDAAYKAAQERKANAWEDGTQHTTGDTQVQRDAAYQEFLAKRHGTTDSKEVNRPGFLGDPLV
ncbi:DUF2213 domain-containing protein [Halomonas salifodinae]|uniref:DUF2213 domain-containing protein n=1 Tax=Halomonas salifodinae TaxID=438745 RepID=A0ABW2EY43_9GAMM